MSKSYIPPRALFIGAHPDDVEFIGGGTAALWAKNGSEVVFVLATDGNIGSHEQGMTMERLIELRRDEQRAAARVIGAKECIFLGHHDGLLQGTLELRREIVRLVRKYRPNAVVTTDPTDFFISDDYINHPDHRAIATAVIDAVFPASEMPLLYPEMEAEGLQPHKANYIYVRGTTGLNTYIDISEVIEVKIEALRQHKSQFDGWDPAESIRQWGTEEGKKVGYRYAEAFRRIMLKELE